MTPVNTPDTWTKILSTLKDLPLWLIAAVAVFLIIFLSVPIFNGLVTPTTRLWTVAAAVFFSVLTFSRFASIATSCIRSHYAKHPLTFHLTPIPEKCFISVAKQPDGSMVTQIGADFLAKNRADTPLRLVNASTIKPKISGEQIQSLVLIRALRSNMYGTSHASDYFIPPQSALPVGITILTRGVPKKWGKIKTFNAVLAVTDDDGNEERIKIPLKVMP